MALGQKCPECGKNTLHPPKSGTGVRVCGNPDCKARGWHGQAKPKGAGKGEQCLICGNNTYRVVATLPAGGKVKYCALCEAVAII